MAPCDVSMPQGLLSMIAPAAAWFEAGGASIRHGVVDCCRVRRHFTTATALRIGVGSP